MSEHHAIEGLALAVGFLVNGGKFDRHMAATISLIVFVGLVFF